MNPLQNFVAEFGEVRQRGGSSSDLLAVATPLFSTLLGEVGLPAALLISGAQRSTRYLLHRSATVTVFAIASPPGYQSTVHDHRSWGLVGQVIGEEVERVYTRHACDRGLTRLDCATARNLVPGDIVTLLPPGRDLHSVATIGAAVSVTLHAFADDPVSGGFTYYEPAAYVGAEYRGRYDNEEVGGDGGGGAAVAGNTD